jgi:hypothetical protein
MLLDPSNEMVGACTYGEKKNAYRVLVRKPEGKRPLGRLKRRWEDDIACKMGFKGI